MGQAGCGLPPVQRVERAARRRLREMEDAVAEGVEVGGALFGEGEPSDPELLRRHQLYKRVKAALALP